MRKNFLQLFTFMLVFFLISLPVYASEEEIPTEETTEEAEEESSDNTTGPVQGEGNTFSFGGRLIPLNAERLDLSGINLRNSNVDKLFDNMPNLKTVKLIDCGLSNDGYAALQDKFPRIRMIWDIQFSRRKLRIDSVGYSSFRGGALDQWMTDEDAKYLKYCRDMVAVDLGHNPVHNLDFLQYMPNLKILIMVDNHGLKDLTNLRYVPQLTYFELFVNSVSDLSVFQNLHQMEDLNISYNPISSTEYLKDFPKLQRMWMESTRVPYDDFLELCEIYPDATMVYYGSGSVDKGWRVGSHYNAMRAIVKDNEENEVYHKDYIRYHEDR